MAKVHPANKGKGRSESRWWLTEDFSNDTIRIFKTFSKMYARFDTNAVTWNSATEGVGVKKKTTAIDLVMKLFDFLDDQKEKGFPQSDDYYRLVVRKTHEKYRRDIDDMAYDKHVRSEVISA